MSRDYISPTEAAAMCRVKRVAIHSAIKKGRLKAVKVKNRWHITISALDEYRESRYSRMGRKLNGELVFDIAAGRWPVQYVAKWLGNVIDRTISENKIYYLMRIGLVQAYRRGNAWMIKREDAEALYKKLMHMHDSEIVANLRLA